ncbi:FAD-dependent thymidylate synthase [Iamia majanohamensis]|uniref:FAD-dependent thymidylate synthase n=1 Tax=Iamia majanohamensis TaxID=467976 RepID=A0AAF0BTZ8_9ACTN|nr:FAD-dependent thymidylate synthase [Iamia majanohamensis]WCO65004.1 FAD-dependent thymidylate synthase [Iamia majanohamensis]
MSVYVPEEFSPEEGDVLRRYFTNLDGPVFALVNLPEVVKGALFARYSRSSKSLRRLFLDEFVGELDISGDATIDATVGLRRAEELYDRVFFEYGDDSVAQLGGVHLACEQASNLLTKVLEWGRLMAYLEQSTRYIAYDSRLGGRYRYLRDPAILGSPLGTRYVGDMDRLFDTYASLVPRLQDFFRERFPKEPGDSDLVYRQAVRAKAFDALRGILPAASLSNVGIYGTGQGYEQLLLRMRAHPLPEARSYADLMLGELRKVIPSFLKRVDLDDRGVAWSTYLASTRTATEELAERLFPVDVAPDAAPGVTLTSFDPDAEVRLVTAMLYPSTHVPEAQVERRVREMTTAERMEVVHAYVGDRSNRRHKPGRALERLSYRFDVLADYGAFRDLQRHRMLTVEWQALSPRHGYTRPEAVDLAGHAAEFDDAMGRSAELHDALLDRFPAQAPYATCLAYKVRFSMQMNAREAMHMLELRSTPQGHPAYREVAQDMHRLIAEEAGHPVVAELMRYVDHTPEPALERLDAERRAEARRQSR